VIYLLLFIGEIYKPYKAWCTKAPCWDVTPERLTEVWQRKLISQAKNSEISL